MNQTHHHSIHIPSSSSSESDLEAGVLHFQFYPSSSSYSSIPRRPLAVFFSFSDEPANGPHFLDSCHLCLKPLGSGRDIFMYRGDTPFCSEECRNEQIEMDEAEEKRLKKTKKMNQQRKSASHSKSEGLQLSAPGTVVAG